MSKMASLFTGSARRSRFLLEYVLKGTERRGLLERELTIYAPLGLGSRGCFSSGAYRHGEGLLERELTIYAPLGLGRRGCFSSGAYRHGEGLLERELTIYAPLGLGRRCCSSAADLKTSQVDGKADLKTRQVDPKTRPPTDPARVKLFIIAKNLESLLLWIARCSLRLGSCFLPLVNFVNRVIFVFTYALTFGKCSSPHRYDTQEEGVKELVRLLSPLILLLISWVVVTYIFPLVSAWILGEKAEAAETKTEEARAKVDDKMTKDFELMRSRITTLENDVVDIKKFLSSPLAIIKRILGF